MATNRYEHLTDNELLNRYNSNHNQQWLGVLLERYTLLLYGVCMKYLKDEHAAKDCVQQIFLKVLTEVSRYKIDYFKSWLYMVAKNHCLMRLRDKAGREIIELKDGYKSYPETQTKDPKENERTYQKLEEAINELNEEQRQCVLLFYINKYSYQQITEKTGYSLMQVKSYIQNGKRNLKLILDKKFKEANSRENG